MNTIQRIAKNTSVLLISRIASYILRFFYMMYTARYLGAEEFGILSFALAFTGIFGIFTDIGLNILTTREVSRDRSLATKYLGNIVVMKVILVVITFGLIALTVNLLGYPQQTISIVYLIALSVIFNAFSQTFYPIFQAYEKMEYQSSGEILNSVLMLIGVLFAISYGFDVVAFASIYFIVSAIVFGYSFFVCVWKFVLPKIEINLSFWKPMIKEALLFGLGGIFVTIYFWIDSVMLSLMIGNKAVGLYNAPYRLIMALLFIPSALIMSIFPVMSKHFKFEEDLLKQEYKTAFKYLFIIAIFLFIYGLIFADKIILIIYGNGYMPSIKALRVLIWVIPIIFLTSLLGNFLFATNKQRIVTGVAGANVVLNVFLNILLIPKFSYIGASIATVLTEGLGFILMFGYISRYFFRISITQNIIKPICSAAFVAILVYFLKQYLNWVLVGLLGILIYPLVLYVVHIITKDDVNLIKQIFQKR